MNNSELLKINTGAITAEYDQTDSFPVSPTTDGIGLNIINTDASNALTVTVTHDDATTTALTIPANTGWNDLLNPFKSFTKSGASTAFIIQVRSIR